MTTLDDALAQMEEFGLDVDYPIADGKIQRVTFQQESRSKKSGWYTLHKVEDLFSGTYGSWKVREEGFAIIRRNSAAIETDRAKKMRAEIVKRSEARREEKKRIQNEAAKKANEIWDSCKTDGASEYLTRKGAFPHGARFYKGSTLVIPMVKSGNIRSLQCISSDGFKKFLKGGEVSGCYFLIKGKTKLAICEGFATGSTIHQATGWSVAICFSASNLTKAAPYFKRKDCIICADNDEAGLTYGKRAADDLGCKMIYPPNEGQDFNDLTIDEAKRCLI